MPKSILIITFYGIATILVSGSIFCSEVSFCDQTPFPELCDSIVGPDSDSRESASMNQAREDLGHFLAMPRTTFHARAKAAWLDCLELYEDAKRHLNLSARTVNPTDVGKLLSATLVNHQACLNGFKDSVFSSNLKNLLQNFSKSLVDLLAKNKPADSNFPTTTSDHGLIQLAEVAASTQANLVVAQDGSGHFKTISEAIQAAENQRVGTDRFVIYVKSGVYKETFIINQSMMNLTLIGDGIDSTVITNNKNYYDEGYQTYNTSTVQVWGGGFIAVGITFENTAGPQEQQAIALLSASDLSAFYRCSFKGYQDTLCILEFRQFYRECDIYGTVDFIFGDASAVLQKCNIYVREPIPGQENVLTAQGRTNASSSTGFVIHNSRITATPELALTNGAVRTYLGRPWKDFSRVIFAKCYLDSLIDPQGWMPYEGSSAFTTVYYAEYMNRGSGANTGGRVTWRGYHAQITGEEADQFSVRNFLNGDAWIPRTGVPFDSGL